MVRKTKIYNPVLEFEEVPFNKSDFEEEIDPNEIAKAIAEAQEDKIRWEKEGKPALEALMKTNLWAIVDDAIDTLTKQQDIIETTARQNIVSYIICALEQENLLREDPIHGQGNKSKNKKTTRISK